MAVSKIIQAIEEVGGEGGAIDKGERIQDNFIKENTGLDKEEISNIKRDKENFRVRDLNINKKCESLNKIEANSIKNRVEDQLISKVKPITSSKKDRRSVVKI